MDEPEVAEDLALIAAEQAEIEADEAEGEDDAEVVYMKRRAVRGEAPPR